jgi:hypothetical protein
MCDCYEHGCEICKKPLPIHIGDFIVDRKDIEVYCGLHIPKHFHGAIWLFTEEKEYDFEDSKLHPAGTKMAIKLNEPNYFLKSGLKNYREHYEDWLHPNWCNTKIIKTQKVAL